MILRGWKRWPYSPELPGGPKLEGGTWLERGTSDPLHTMHFRDEQDLDNYNKTVGFHGHNVTYPQKHKAKITKTTNATDTKDEEIAVPLRYFHNFGELLKC